jgi:hypothetical protein
VFFTLRHPQKDLQCLQSFRSIFLNYFLCLFHSQTRTGGSLYLSPIISLHLTVCLLLTISVCSTLRNGQEGLHCVSNHFTPSYCLSFSNCLFVSLSDTDRRVSTVSPIISLHLTVCLFLTVSVCFALRHGQEEGFHCVSNHFTPSYCLSSSNCLCLFHSQTRIGGSPLCLQSFTPSYCLSFSNVSVCFTLRHGLEVLHCGGRECTSISGEIRESTAGKSANLLL